MKRGKKNKKTHGIGKDYYILEGLKLLSQSNAKYLIVGGVASNLHGLSRGTKDIDILIPKDLKNTEKILKALENLTWGLSKEIFPEEVISKPFTIIGDMPRVDLLLQAGKICFNDAYPRREEKKLANLKLPVVSFEDLILSKNTDRPRDLLEIKEMMQMKKLKKKLK